MAISDPIGRARAVRTALQAARLMARIEHEISEDCTASEEWHEQADQAIDELRRRFLGARRLDAYMEPPLSSSAARAGLREPPEHPSGSSRQRPSERSGVPTAGSARRRRRVRHALEAAGVLAVAARCSFATCGVIRAMRLRVP
jgi:hypothetical protein